MTWTPEQAVGWEEAWKQPVMQQGLAHLRELTRLRGGTTEFDAAEVLQKFALIASYAQGQTDVLDKIESMKARPAAKQLPNQFEINPRPKPPVQ